MVAPAITRLPGETYEEYRKRYLREYQRERRKNPENKKRDREYGEKRRRNPGYREQAAERTAKWRQVPGNKKRQAERRRDPENKKRKAKSDARRRQRLKDDPHDKRLRRARSAKHRARKKHACPAWASLDEIKAKYAERDRLERETGIPHHVDHIVPLGGKNVCGLHVPWNLRVIPANENRSKGNRLTPEVLELCHSTPQETLLLSA